MMPMGGDATPPMESDFQINDNDNSNFNNDEDALATDSKMPSEFDSNFDAGVEADEETDPKKYIQQLTGKLSQSLNSYNNDNDEPDTELGKYVLGMLIKQGTKGMDEKDRKEIIKKINTNNSELEDEEYSENEENNYEENDDENLSDDSEEIKMENKKFNFTKKQIFENFGITMDNEKKSNIKKELDTKITSDTKKNRKTRPFEAPKKFKI